MVPLVFHNYIQNVHDEDNETNSLRQLVYHGHHDQQLGKDLHETY